MYHPINGLNPPFMLRLDGYPKNAEPNGGDHSYSLLLNWNLKGHEFNIHYASHAWTALYRLGFKSSIPVFHTSGVPVASMRLRTGDIVSVASRLGKADSTVLLQEIVQNVLPNTRPFRGLSPKGADGNGNFTFPIIQPRIFDALANHYDMFMPLCSKPSRSVTVQTRLMNRNSRLREMRNLGLPVMRDRR
jgi:ribosomal protein L5